MASDGDVGSVLPCHFYGEFNEVPGVVQLLVDLQQGHLRVRQYRIAEFIGVEFGAGMGYDVFIGT